MEDPWAPDQAASVRAVGKAARGWVRVELDGVGQVVDVVVEERAMSMSAAQLSEALKAAFRQAQSDTRAQLEGLTDRFAAAVPSQQRLARVLDETNAATHQRFNEVTAVLYDLDRRAGRQW